MFGLLIFSATFPILITRSSYIKWAYANETEYNFQVSILYEGCFVCGGAVIDARWVLVPVHCVFARISPNSQGKDGFVESLTVRVASTDAVAGGMLYRVTDVIYHRSLSEGENGLVEIDSADLALLHVGPLPLGSLVDKIAVFEGECMLQESAIISGWGWLREKSSGPHDFLKIIPAKIVNETDCGYEIEDVDLVCTSDEDGSETCEGDTAGILTVQVNQTARLYGISANLEEKCVNGYPNVFTCIGAYADWIQKVCGCVN